VGGDYDWIGFDPRGVGASRPALTCDSDYLGYNRPYYVPVNRTLERTWLNRARGYAEACDRAGGALLDHVKTTDTVADMESIRRALGQRQINFYGFSYGTYLGQVYATLHPNRVRRMVLDANVDPGRVWYQANLDQDYAFDRNIDIYFAWIARYDAVYHLGTTARAVERTYYATLQRLRAAPAGGLIGPSELTDIFTSAGYAVYGWEAIAEAFSAWVNDRDPAPLVELYPAPAPGADNGYAMYLATECTDVRWPQSWSKWKRDNWRVHARAPFLTWANAWFNAPCLYWGAKPGKPVDVNGKKAPPILLISETFDAATPFSGSLEVRERFPRSALVEGVGGTTHAASLSGIACTDNTVAAYLDTGALPRRLPGNRSDKRCDPIPQPDPTETAARTLATADGTRAALRESATVR
jgi:pimeloyl-ACP methyl ester carboxylesterase